MKSYVNKFLKATKQFYKLFVDPFIHLYITLCAVLLTMQYEHAIRTTSVDKLNGYWIYLIISALTLALIVILSIRQTSIEKINKDLEIMTRQSEISKITAESDSKVSELNAEMTKTQTESDIRLAELKKEIALTNPVQVVFKKNEPDDDKAYNTSLNVVKEAKESILIVADYSPPKGPLEISSKRVVYYKTIEDILEQKIHDTNNKFVYKRYMQRPDDIFLKICKNRGEIDNYLWIEGDEQAFAHCKKILELKKSNLNNKVEIELYITPIIPSLPSILIVDDDKLLFTIPQRKINDKIDTLNNIDPVETAGVLDFTDLSPKGRLLVTPFKNIVNSLAKDEKRKKDEIQELVMFKEFKNNDEIIKKLDKALTEAEIEKVVERLNDIKSKFDKWYDLKSN